MNRRGWCPSLFAPMQSGDGMLLRVKPRLGVIPAPEARALADAARQLGNGMLGLTNRGNLQLRGFTEESAAEFARIIVALGLANPDPASEARRNVAAPPLIGLDPALHPGCFDLVRRLDDTLARRTEFAPLHGKFGIVVDGGGALPMSDVACDILLQPDRDGVLISLDGSVMAARVKQDEAVDATLNLIRAFIAAGPLRRMREANADAIFAAAGLSPAAMRLLRPARPAIGALPGAFGLGLPVGLLQAADLEALADLAEMRGDSTLRLTPFRALLIPGITALPRLALPATKAITDPGDPLLRVQACPGAPYCASASVNTQEAGVLVAAELTWQGVLHVSGCKKGCARPTRSPLTLVGDAGAWTLVRNGRADGTAELYRQPLTTIVQHLAAETSGVR